MSKDFAWQLFKNTGNLDAFMIMREYEEIGEELTPNRDLDGAKDGNNKDKRNSNYSSKFIR